MAATLREARPESLVFVMDDERKPGIGHQIERLDSAERRQLKLRLVVPDRLVDLFREAYGDMAEVIPISETMLPL